jgi:hypothetical protein
LEANVVEREEGMVLQDQIPGLRWHLRLHGWKVELEAGLVYQKETVVLREGEHRLRQGGHSNKPLLAHAIC